MTADFDTDIPAGEALAVRLDGATDFVRGFEHRKDLVRRGFALLAEADFVASKDERFDDADDAIEHLERAAWHQIAERFELHRVMSVKAHQEFWEQIRKDEMPPITVDNVLAFVAGIRSQIPDMHKAAVLEVHNWLRPHEWDHVHRLKTNTELEVGKRVVLSHMVEDRWGGQLQIRIGSGYHADPRLRLLALERVLLAREGRGMVAADDYSEIQKAIDGRWVDGTSKRGAGEPVGDTEMFRYSACKNGNLHLEWKRLDLLARFNSLAGGKTLKPEKGNKSPRSTKATRKPPEARPVEQRGDAELGFFATPDDLADRVVALADIRMGEMVLEPSAGEGALVSAVRRLSVGPVIRCVEIHPERVEALERADFVVEHADFLSIDPTHRAEWFDAVVMNPPFANRLDVTHVEHALKFLRHGGSLVAVMSAGAMFRQDHLTVEFRRSIDERGGRFEKLEPGAFAESGTMVNACLCIVPRKETSRV